VERNGLNTGFIELGKKDALLATNLIATELLRRNLDFSHKSVDAATHIDAQAARHYPSL
jgi:hypothetical protein